VAPTLRLRLDKETIRASIGETVAEAEPVARRHEADTLTTSAGQRFATQFANARLPDCLHADGLRNQPTFFLSGFLALPFIAVAKVRGVCR
jgi:hypothetical protein